MAEWRAHHIIILGTSLAIAGLLLLVGFKEPGLSSINADGINFDYPGRYRPLPLDSLSGNSEQLVKLGQKDPFASIEVNKETGVLDQSGDSSAIGLDQLEAGAIDTLPSRYSHYHLLSVHRLQAATGPVSLIQFSYIGSDQQTKLFASLFIIPITHDAYYLTLQSTDEQQLNRDTQIIKNSLR